MAFDGVNQRSTVRMLGPSAIHMAAALLVSAALSSLFAHAKQDHQLPVPRRP